MRKEGGAKVGLLLAVVSGGLALCLQGSWEGLGGHLEELRTEQGQRKTDSLVMSFKRWAELLWLNLLSLG